MIQKRHCVGSGTSVPENTRKARASTIWDIVLPWGPCGHPAHLPSNEQQAWPAMQQLKAHNYLANQMLFLFPFPWSQNQKVAELGLRPGVFYSRSVLSCIHCPQLHNWGGHGGSDDKESTFGAGDLGSTPGSGRSPGGGHGNPLKYSCLENSVDRGDWQVTVHGVAKNQTWLSD